jgi:hypothetical protein
MLADESLDLAPTDAQRHPHLYPAVCHVQRQGLSPLAHDLARELSAQLVTATL